VREEGERASYQEQRVRAEVEGLAAVSADPMGTNTDAVPLAV
jgi:hypothetical protein